MNERQDFTETRMPGLRILAASLLVAMTGVLWGCGEKPAEPACWSPFVPAATGADMREAPSDPSLLKCRPEDKGTAAEREVVVGNVRVQLLSPTLVRLEQRGPKGFENRCTFVVVDRDWPGVPHEVSRSGTDTLIDAGGYRVQVPGDGESLAGVKVLAADGKALYTADGQVPPRDFLPAPSEHFDAWAMGDMPRLVPPSWGATPPPPTCADSGWDTANDAPDIYVFVPGAGGHRQLRRDFLKLTGPVELPPLFTFGLWMSRYFAYTEQTALDTIDGFRERKIPLDLLVVDTDWRIGGSHGYAPDPQYFPDMPRFFTSAHERNARIMFNDHPEPQGGSLDPEELAFRYEGLTGLLAQGLDVWWFDRNWWTCLAEPVPGISKEVWGMRLYHDVTERFVPDRRPLIMSNVEGIDQGFLNQTSSPAAHRFPIWWTGDTRATWAFLKRGMENGVVSGVRSLLPYVNEDAGGHHGDPDPELYTRFMQFASLSPVMRPHCTKGQKRLPWEFGPEAEQIVGDYVRLRYRLLPTIYAAARRAYDDGTPLMRRLDLEWPDHAEAADNTEYLLGDDLLVAPMHGNPAVPLTAADVKTPAGEPGFLGEYFASKDLSGTPAHTRTDGEINFDWAMGEPAPGLPADSFSVRWTGTIGPVATGGEAVFAVTADDGVRLWVNDQLVVDQWVDQAATEWTAAVDMKAGKSYEVKVEYFENAGNAICQLLWQPPGHPPTNARSVWLPPGVWHDAWTGAAATGPVAVQATLPLRQMPLYFRDGGIIATIPQIEHTAAAAWPTVVLDVFVPDEPSELVPADSLFVRTERVIYEDDGTSPGYRVGQYSVTPVVLERNGCGTRLVLGPTAGTFPGLPATRSWVVRLHLPRGTEPDSLTVAGDEWPLGPPQAAIPGHLLEPAAGDLMPLSGQLSAPGSDAGPVAELWLSDQDVRAAIEIGLVTRTER